MKKQNTMISSPLPSATTAIRSDTASWRDVRIQLILNGRTETSAAKTRVNTGKIAQIVPSKNDLSPREHEVLHWLAHGKSGPEISIILGISLCTVRIHIQSAKRKLNAVNIPHSIYLAFALGILRS